MNHVPATSGLARSRLVAAGHYLPPTVVSSTDVEKRIRNCQGMRLPRGALARVTGVQQRSYRTSENASDLAVAASRHALDRAGLPATDVDVLIFASCSQDLIEPATANIVQTKLGATNAQAFDVKNACNSFLNALDIADSLVCCGKANTVLIAVGETPSLGINWEIRSALELRKRIASLTLGDAGGAAIVQRETRPEGGLMPGTFRTFGDKWQLATLLAGGSMHQFDPKYASFVGNPKALRAEAVKHVPGLVQRTLNRIGWSPAEVEVVLCHQVTIELMQTISKRCGFAPDKCVLSVDTCGNTAAATIPIGLSFAYERQLLNEGTKILLVGAAAGFSVGVIPMVW